MSPFPVLIRTSSPGGETRFALVDTHFVHDERCLDCGSLVSSQDEPCPQCASSAGSNDELVVSYEYSKTFTLRFAPLRPYRSERFMAEINAWLREERGLVDVPSLVIQSNQGLVTAITLSCVGISIGSSKSTEWSWSRDSFGGRARHSERT
jgi:hypothetical protein